jgi:hypothetical protein
MVVSWIKEGIPAVQRVCSHHQEKGCKVDASSMKFELSSPVLAAVVTPFVDAP